MGSSNCWPSRRTVRRLFTAGGENLPRLWDLKTGRLLREFTGIPKPQQAAEKYRISPAILSPDGRILAVRSGPTHNLYLLETDTGKRLHEFSTETGAPGNNGLWLNFAFSADSKAIAAHLDRRLEMRDVATGRTLWRTEEFGQQTIAHLTCSPDGKTLASSTVLENVRLWDARTGKLLHELAPRMSIASMAFSPDGRRSSPSVVP